MGNAASALPYAIGKQVAFVNNGWALHEGSRKSDGSPVSVFLAKKPALHKQPVNPRQPNMMQYATAAHHFVHCKKLRHPHILTVTATLDTDNPNDVAPTGIGSGSSHTATGSSSSTAAATGDFIIVTEPCIPLDTWLASRPPLEQVAWGLECMVRSLHFLHASAGLCHGAVSPESFYVTPAGDVKLWNFALVASFATGAVGGIPTVPRHFIDWESLVTPTAFRAPERNEGRWDAIAAAGVQCVDCFALAAMVSHVFGGTVPTPLVKAVQKMQSGNLKLRPRSLQPLLKCPIFDTPYQKMQLQLEEFAVAPVEQKTSFWQNLTPNLQAQVVSEQVAVFKLLPLLLTEIETICGNEGMRSQESYRREGMLIVLCMHVRDTLLTRSFLTILTFVP
jgi:SCY1-like protein 1